jgi:hypothetical protein
MLLPDRIFVALRPMVRTELKMDDAEKQKIIDAFEGALEVEGDMIRLSLSGGTDLHELEDRAEKVLTPDQKVRLEEVWIQSLDGAAVADDAVAKKLGLTDDQKKQADALADRGGQEILDLFSDGPPAEGGKDKMTAIRIKFGKQIEALLTDDQKKAYEQLKGKPLAGLEPKGGSVNTKQVDYGYAVEPGQVRHPGTP